MPRKSKSEPELPTLFKRGKKYCFRRRVNGTDTWISTHKQTLMDAKAFAREYMSAEAATVLESRTEKDAHRLANKFVGVLTGSEEVQTPILNAADIWKAHTPNLSELSEGSRRNYDTIFNRFADWCGSQDISFAEEVDHSAALRYSKVLLESGITGRTYNGHLKHLSRVFSTVDAVVPLPHRDPFNFRKISRIRKGELKTIGKQPLEPEQLQKVLEKSAEYGADCRDLFIIGSQTGMRLKDAALLRWESVNGDFIDIVPFKTKRSRGTARIPVSLVLRQLLERRRAEVAADEEFILPGIADQYQRNYHYVTQRSKEIFEKALGRENTIVSAESGDRRKRNACIYSFHSFRTTLMSLLAARDVSTRDAMRMLGWESPDMIAVYEKMLDKARGDADVRAIDLLNSIDELQYEVPEAAVRKSFRPNAETLEDLVGQYSNRTIGRIYDVSETAVRKWMDKYCITRAMRIVSANLSDEEIAAIRDRLKKS